jgi:hypothetical protein
VINPLGAPDFQMIEFKSSKQKALKFSHRKAMVASTFFLIIPSLVIFRENE